MASVKAVADRCGIAVIEDCAQAQGARIGECQVGAFGELGCLSFYPTKTLGALGDGGAIATGNPALAERLPSFAPMGGARRNTLSSEWPRLAARRNPGRCPVPEVKLLPDNLQRRRDVASRYRAEFAGLPLILPYERPGYTHAYHLFVIRSRERDALATHLRGSGVGTGRHYPWPVHLQPGLAARARIPHPLPVTERIAMEISAFRYLPPSPWPKSTASSMQCLNSTGERTRDGERQRDQDRQSADIQKRARKPSRGRIRAVRAVSGSSAFLRQRRAGK